MLISIKGLEKSYNDLTIFNKFDIVFESNEIACLLGPSGCGKTTLLNVISGLEKPNSIELGGFDPKNISYLFQEPRLLPWKTVWDNIAFVLKERYTKVEAAKVVDNYIRIVGLWDYKDYYPHELSGGMKQRASIARAFAYPSEVLLMDEPFKGLDPKLKSDLIKSFLELWNKDKRTVVFVTHEIDEAVAIGETVHILSDKPVTIKKTIQVARILESSENKNQTIIDLKEQIHKELDIL